MNEILSLVKEGGAGLGIAGGVSQFAFGRNEQIDASKYSITKPEDDGKKFMASLAFVGGAGVLVLIILVFAFRK